MHIEALLAPVKGLDMMVRVGDQKLTARMTAEWCCCSQFGREVSWKKQKHCAEERQGGLETFMTLAIEPEQ